MTGFENHAGFTISGSKLQVVDVANHGSQFILENVDEAYFNEPIDFENDKETKISALLQGAYNELLIKKPLSTSSVSFTLPLELFEVIQVPYDNTLLNQDLIEEFRWELSVLFPYLQTKNLVIQYIEIEKNNLIDINTAAVIALPRKYLQLINNFCLQNNLRLKFVDNIHLASDKALAVSNPSYNSGLTMSVYFSNKNLSVIFALGGKPIYFNLIPLSDAGEITNYLLEEISPKGFFKVNKNSIDTAFICGDDLSSPVLQKLQNATGLEFIRFNPFDKIKPNPELFENKCYTEKFNSFSSAAGMAYRIG